MALSKPNRLILDAFSDPQISNVSSYSSFTTRFPSSIQKAKGLSLISASLVNTTLQLNDQSQLMFWFYIANSSTNIRDINNLKCIRLAPSNQVPKVGEVNQPPRNRYFNSVDELVTALNIAATTNGDNVFNNPHWYADAVTFAYDSTQRKILVSCNTAGYFVGIAAHDDPNIAIKMAANRITYAGFGDIWLPQPYTPGVTMNSRLGFGQGVNAIGVWYGPTSQYGIATPTGVPMGYQVPIYPTSSPILLGSQQVGLYLDVIPNGGYDGTNRNLLASVPITAPSLNVLSYTPSTPVSIDTLPDTMSEISVRLIDENGLPYIQPPSYNVRLELSVTY